MDFKSFVYHKLVYPSIITLDRFRGLDFLTDIQAKDVGLDPKFSYGYSPSTKRFLKEVLNDFDITSQDSIIDVGCGKGYAMRTMLKSKFREVDGIELSDYIGNIGKRNFEKLNFHRSKISITDAAKFKEYDNYNFVYFFNPFPSVVMSEVINSLIESLRRLDRELIIIYLAPTCHDVIIGNGVFTNVGVYHRKGSWITIYSNRNSNNSKTSANKRMQPIQQGSELSKTLEIYLDKHPTSQKLPVSTSKILEKV